MPLIISALDRSMLLTTVTKHCLDHSMPLSHYFFDHCSNIYIQIEPDQCCVAAICSAIVVKLATYNLIPVHELLKQLYTSYPLHLPLAIVVSSE